MAGRISNFLGGSPLSVFIRLLVISGIVGFIMHWLGFYPDDVLRWLVDGAVYLYESGFALLGDVLHYILLGGIIVVPIFLLSRILRSGGGRSS